MNKILFLKPLIIACVMMLITQLAFSQHEHHAQHNMVMMGEKDIFISHIVYKVPHNYQVILQVNLDEMTLKHYLKAREALPDNMLVLLLDHMDISKIADMSSISGTIYTEDKQGVREEIISNVVIDKANYKIIFFDQVPLILGK